MKSRLNAFVSRYAITQMATDIPPTFITVDEASSITKSINSSQDSMSRCNLDLRLTTEKMNVKNIADATTSIGVAISACNSSGSEYNLPKAAKNPANIQMLAFTKDRSSIGELTCFLFRNLKQKDIPLCVLVPSPCIGNAPECGIKKSLGKPSNSTEMRFLSSGHQYTL